MGDPLGIGPEIIVKSLADSRLREHAVFAVFASQRVLADAAASCGIVPFWVTSPMVDPGPDRLPPPVQRGSVVVVEPSDLAEFDPATGNPREPSASSGLASIACLEAAVTAAKHPTRGLPTASAIVTAPISKTAWNLAGLTTYPGHTEFLADRFGARRHAMLFHGPALRVILVTIHIPLARVPASISTGAVFDAIELGHQACRRLAPLRPPHARPARIGVCGINPHAGEDGLLGDEDRLIIRPAVEHARSTGIDVHGPLPADSLFAKAARGEFDLVVAMYHDQGLIPVKLLDRERTVNVTVGLPRDANDPAGHWLVRTSPAHGTAFDIAGHRKADATSMTAAIEFAIRSIQ
ncbi:MAG: 4-hydroxythreonine-4-phosphate dehydrogenase PdxA [Phycisphaerales bacterium]